MMSRMSGPQGLDPFNTLQREMGRVFEEVLRGFTGAGRGALVPSLDVCERGDRLEVTAELPGIAQEDIDLRVEGDLLTLCGEKKDSRGSDAAGVQLTERSYGRFQRSFRLPFSPDPGQVTARFEHGVLHVTLPRPAEHKGMGRIPIGGAGRERPQEQGSAPHAAGGSQNAPKQESHSDEVDEAARDSFPASDPPSWSGGTTTTGAPAGGSSTPGPSGAASSGS